MTQTVTQRLQLQMWNLLLYQTVTIPRRLHLHCRQNCQLYPSLSLSLSLLLLCVVLVWNC